MSWWCAGAREESHGFEDPADAQLGFSVANRTMTASMSSVTWAPSGALGLVQCRRTIRRCQENNVTGVTMSTDQRSRASTRLSRDNHARSLGSRRGRGRSRRRMSSSRRRTRISISLDSRRRKRRMIRSAHAAEPEVDERPHHGAFSRR